MFKKIELQSLFFELMELVLCFEHCKENEDVKVLLLKDFVILLPVLKVVRRNINVLHQVVRDEETSYYEKSKKQIT